MRFQSTATAALDFEIGGRRYEVPVGGVCDIPDRYAYAVESYGLPLKPIGKPAPEPEKDAPCPRCVEASEKLGRAVACSVECIVKAGYDPASAQRMYDGMMAGPPAGYSPPAPPTDDQDSADAEDPPAEPELPNAGTISADEIAAKRAARAAKAKGQPKK